MSPSNIRKNWQHPKFTKEFEQKFENLITNETFFVEISVQLFIMVLKVIRTASEADKHSADVTVLFSKNRKLYSGANDGKIKIWDTDLKLEKTIDAHPVNVYDLTANDKFLYSCSNDGTVKAWNLMSADFVQSVTENPDEEILKLFYTNDKLYAGDVKGNVKVFENQLLVSQYEMFEEITGLCVKDNIVFTAGTLDVVVTEMKPGNKSQFTTWKTENGRGPLSLINDSVFFISRDGRSLMSMNATNAFQVVGTFEGHELIVNALCGDERSGSIFSGGYDKCLKMWDLKSQSCSNSVDIGQCINSIAVNDDGVYVAADDSIFKVADA